LQRFVKQINFVLLLLFYSISLSLCAKPTVSRANLKYGFSPRIKRYSWGNLHYQIVNPDSESYNIETRFIDANRGAINQKTVFSNQMFIPPKTVIQYSTPVMTENTEEYRLEVFLNGEVIQKSDSFLIALITGQLSYLPILNDSDDVSLGSFSTAPEFKGLYAPSNFRSQAPALPWTLLKKAVCLIIVRPDFSRFSDEAYRAVLNYVQQGGNVIFADPVGALAASKTPLAVLLPVVPLKMRKIKILKSLSKWNPEFKEFAKNVDFLESIPRGDGINFLEENSFPVFRWKKYGLGTCRFSAIPIIRQSFTSQANWFTALQFFLTHQSISNDLSTSISTLDEMTGFSVPRLRSIQMIFLVYFILLVTILGLGLFYKKTGISWMLTALMTIIFSMYILQKAASSNSKKSGVFVSFIETFIPGQTAAPGEGWYGIFSSSDTSMTIKADSEQTSLSAVPPSDNIMAMFNNNGGGIQAKLFTSPTEVKNINALPEIWNLVLNSNASRQFYAAFDAVGFQDLPHPTLQYKEDGFSFQPWTIPEGLKPYAAWLQFANGIAPLKIQGGKILIDTSSNAVFSSDTSLLSLQTFMKHGWKHSSPMMVLVENKTKTNLHLPEKIISHGKRLTVVPVQEICTTETLTVPVKSVLLTSGNTSTRLLMMGNDIKPTITSRADSSYIFRYQLPPLFAKLRAEKIKVNLQYSNDSGNIDIQPILLIGEIKSRKFIQKKELIGKKISGKYVFNDVSECLHNASGFIALKIKIKQKKLPMGEWLRANKWSLDSLEISVTGKMPKNAQLFKF